jgi:hypothetical protein
MNREAVVQQTAVQRDCLAVLIQLVQQAAVPRDLVSPLCYSWYN